MSSALNEQYIRPTKEKVAERGGMGAILKSAASGVKAGGSSLVSGIMTKSSTFAGNLSSGYNSMPDGGAGAGASGAGDGEHYYEDRDRYEGGSQPRQYAGADTGSSPALDASGGGGGTLSSLKKSMSSFLGTIASATSGRSGYADADSGTGAHGSSNDFTATPRCAPASIPATLLVPLYCCRLLRSLFPICTFRLHTYLLAL